MAENGASSGEIKRGEKAICDWLKVTSQVLRSLRDAGMPHMIIGRQLWVHTGAVNDWFYRKGKER